METMIAPPELEIVNRVAQSGLITLNPDEFRDPHEGVLFDLKPILFQELILREKDLREFAKTHDWSQYQDQNVALHCSVEVVIPSWAYMFLTIHLEPYAHFVFQGTLEQMELALMLRNLNQTSFEPYQDQRVVVKGCGSLHPGVYVEISRRLRPFARTIMYGEPCSTIPLYKKGKP